MSDLKIQNADGFENDGKSLFAQANGLQVIDDATYKTMGEILLKIKSGIKQIEPQINEPIKKAHELHKWLTGVREKVMAPWRQAETIADRRMYAWRNEQMIKRQKEAARLEAEAKAKAEAEKFQEAEKAMDNGDLKKCEKILEAPVMPEVVATTLPEPPKIEGIRNKPPNWDFVVDDVDSIPRDYMTPDVTLIRKIVKAQGKVCRIPGIRVYDKNLTPGREDAA